MGGIFVDGNGGINAQGIRLALEAYNIPKEMWKEYIDKIMIYLITALKTKKGE